MRSIARDEEERQLQLDGLAKLLPETRIGAETEVIVKPADQSITEILHQTSASADVVFLGLQEPEPEARRPTPTASSSSPTASTPASSCVQPASLPGASSENQSRLETNAVTQNSLSSAMSDRARWATNRSGATAISAVFLGMPARR